MQHKNHEVRGQREQERADLHTLRQLAEALDSDCLRADSTLRLNRLETTAGSWPVGEQLAEATRAADTGLRLGAAQR